MNIPQFAACQFAGATTEHELAVLQDDGLYRHLRCRKPGTGLWGWDVITWPGYLAVTGDLGSFTFCREPDMLRDFFTGPVNVSYWLEKCVAWSTYAHQRGVVSLDKIRRRMGRRPLTSDELAQLEELDGSPHVDEAIRILIDELDEPDAWDWPIAEPDLHAVRILHCIAWTRSAYLAEVGQ